MTLEYKYAVGDRVVYVNDFGVCFGIKVISALAERSTSRDDRTPPLPAYHYEGTDTPWFPSKESNFTPANEDDERLALVDGGYKLQLKHGWPTPQEDLDALLDGDPFEGER